MNDSDAPTPSEPPTEPKGWWLLLRGMEVRLRFVFALALLGGLMAGWPWLRGSWERVRSIWHRHPGSAAVSGDTEFFCPMDPGVVSAWPAICPICNMDLIPRKMADAVLLPEGVLARMQLSPYRVQLAGVRTVAVEPRADPEHSDTEPVLIVPQSAVVDHGGERVVFVERMPGMYDGVPVKLGPREGEVYPVVEGLQAGQRIVSAGAFLLDAESRLNPSLATQYFGANSSTSGRIPALPQRSANAKKSTPPLSAEEQAMVERQRICPVTDASLGSMVQPIPVMVQGRKVFLCCRGCESALLADPQKYLVKLPAGDADDSP